MTWEEAVEYLRQDKLKQDFIKDSYLERDLVKNIEQFKASEEFKRTIELLNNYTKEKKNSELTILDIGAGNGISSVSYALLGYNVIALEPDSSATVGNMAIKKLIQHFNLTNISVVDAFGEKLPFEEKSFDIVYARQVLHHANDLQKFVSEIARVLKNKGIVLTVRDHVTKNEKEKETFLKNHPLHSFYGGENAFSLKEYTQAFENANLSIMKSYSHKESIINYAPLSIEKIREKLHNKTGINIKSKLILNLLFKISLQIIQNKPGRLYSFIAIKN